MTETDRTDDSGRLKIPFPPDDPEAPPSGTASGRSRLSERRPSDPDTGPGNGSGQRAPRLTGARHRPGHSIGRATVSPGRADSPDMGAEASGGTAVPPSDGTAALRPPSGPEDGVAQDPGGVDLVSAPPPDPVASSPPPAEAPEITPDGADVPVSRFAGTGVWAAATAGRLKQLHLPKLTRTPGPDTNGAEGSGATIAGAAPVVPDAAAAGGTRGWVESAGAEPVFAGSRPSPRRPDLSGLQDMQVRTASGRMPDWMARRIAESEAPGAAYELGKARRWRRRKITVLRSRTDRRLIRRIDTWTVFKVSFMFYLLMVIIVLIAGIATWNVAEHLGFIGDIQKSVRSLADDKSFVFHGRVALRWAAIGGAALGLLGTLFNTVAAMLYNLLSDVIGGLQVVVVTEAD
jgi:hypothetical protein